ncbi:alpha/beta hydrolase [Algihabitans albus]|uniref:alpha/beta hydrolase n=1 Tax=Algihabitans albus TaxID=2164067 RepID=UPI000E5D1941|nr:alpha/beta fold hydrolase [Algihabitans albus]
MSSAAAAESEFSIPGPEGPLSGTLLQPSNTLGAPVVLIIPGSGPTDRDGNSPLGVRASSYALLAGGLADLGIASLRADKRGLGGSARAIADPNAVTIADYASDTKAWVAAIRTETAADCVWLAGHSEGALIALVAAQDPRNICGLILLAGPGRPLGTILREQLAAGLGDQGLVEQANKAIAALEKGQRVDATTLDSALSPLFTASLQDFLISLFSYDPAALLAELDMPLLILQGREDLQITEVDAERLHNANPDAELLLLQTVNHMLKSVTPGDRRENLESYGDPHRPISNRVVRAIHDFVSKPRRH